MKTIRGVTNRREQYLIFTLVFLAVYSWCCISITSGVLWHPPVLALFHFAS